MKRTKILISAIVVTALAMGAVAAEDAAEKPAERSAEQKVLDRHLGNWQATVVIHKAKWQPNETRATGAISSVRILGGRFTQTNSEGSDGSTSIALATYDVQRKCYRVWWFSSQGTVAESKGKWDAKTKTMTWRNKNDDGVTSVGKVRYPDDNTVEWSSVAKDAEGEIGFHVEGKATRVKQLPKRKEAPTSRPTSKPADRSAEQKVLDFFVGDWKGTSAAPKAPWNPKAFSRTSTSSIVRAIGGRFIQDIRTSDGTAHRWLTTYDVRLKCYRMWYFHSQGLTGECTGKWDAKTRTFTMLSDQDNGITSTGTIRVLDNDTFEWSGVTKDREGKAVFQIKGKNTRAKKPAKKKGG